MPTDKSSRRLFVHDKVEEIANEQTRPDEQRRIIIGSTEYRRQRDEEQKDFERRLGLTFLKDPKL